jgi:hypothetical protein
VIAVQKTIFVDDVSGTRTDWAFGYRQKDQVLLLPSSLRVSGRESLQRLCQNIIWKSKGSS